MAGEKVGDAFVELDVKDAKFNSKMGRAEKRTQKTAGAFAKSARQAALGIGIAFAAMGAFALRAAMKEEQGQADLAAAIKARGGEVSKLLPLLRD